MNISFTKLGCEECFHCEAYKIHKKEVPFDDITTEMKCENCKKWIFYKQIYTDARNEYQNDAKEINKCNNRLTVSADLQKVFSFSFLSKLILVILNFAFLGNYAAKSGYV